MRSKILSLTLLRRLHASLSASHHAPDFESAIRFLKNKLQPDRLITVLDSTQDSSMAARVFNWASNQRNYWHTPATFSRIILKLGMAGECEEMRQILKEMVKLECPETAQALDFLIRRFCGDRRLKEALRVFEVASPVNDLLSVSTCNVLVGALEGSFGSVLFVYKEMVKAGILPDVETFNCLIRGLCENGHLNTALEQLRRISRKQLRPDSRTFEIVVSALCASGRVDESVEVLGRMLEMRIEPQVSFYDSVIPLLCRADRFEEGRKLLTMRERNLSPDLYLYAVLIECLCRTGHLNDAVEVFEEIPDSTEEGGSSKIEPCNALLRGYCDFGKLTDAIRLLDEMADRGSTNSLSWNIVIRGLSQRGYARKAFEVLGKMIVTSYTPDNATYSAIIVGHCKLSAHSDALIRFKHARANSMSLDSESCSELMEGLCCGKKIREASEVFYYAIGEGHMLTASSLDILVRGICLEGEVEESIRMRSLASCNGTSCIPLTYATIGFKLLEMKRVKDVPILLSQMFVEGCSLDAGTYCVLIRGLCNDSTAREAALLFNQMIHHGFVPDTETLEMLVLCMANCSQLHKIMNIIYELINEEGLVSSTVCNTIVSNLLKEGHKLEACKLLDWMLHKNWVPDAETHGLLVGNVNIGERDGTIELYRDDANDKVSDILAEGLENYDGRTVER